MLRQTRDTRTGTVITDRATGDAITLADGAEADIAANARREIAFGASTSPQPSAPASRAERRTR